jgi:hypothetical protein
MDITRDGTDIHKVADFMTLAKHAERRGRFFCWSCGKLLTDLVKSLPNDGSDHIQPCPGCGTKLYFNAAWLAAKVIEAQQRKDLGLGPRIEPPKRGQDPHAPPSPPGSIRVEPLPDGRKNIIVTPQPAAASMKSRS